MNVNAVKNPQSGWLAPEKKEFGADSEINKLTADLEKKESELSELGKEFTKHLSNGEQDMAKLKSVAIQQKQMAIQAMQMQIDKLKEPKQESKNNSNSKNISEVMAVGAVAISPEENLASVGESTLSLERPAAILELSSYAANLLSREE